MTCRVRAGLVIAHVVPVAECDACATIHVHGDCEPLLALADCSRCFALHEANHVLDVPPLPAAAWIPEALNRVRRSPSVTPEGTDAAQAVLTDGAGARRANGGHP